MTGNQKVAMTGIFLMFVLVLLIGTGHIDLSRFNIAAPQGGQPTQVYPTVTFAQGAAKATAKIEGSVMSWSNATNLGSAVLEIYTLPEGGDPEDPDTVWELSEVVTCSSGAYTSANPYTSEDWLLFKVRAGTYNDMKVGEYWVIQQVGYKNPDDENILMPDPIKVPVLPSSVSNVDVLLYDGDLTAIGESDAAATSLDISDGEAAPTDWELRLKLSEEHVQWGVSVQQYATDQGMEYKKWYTIVVVAFNDTDVSWTASGWTKVSDADETKYFKVLDFYNVGTDEPGYITEAVKFNANSLGSGGAATITVTTYDYQNLDDAANNNFNTVAIDPDTAVATYTTFTETFYITLTS